jgi:prepilin-type N-terminal cleavage/methylation domain-containing protein
MKLKNTGFTLIELIVAITIGGIILATVMGSFLTLSKTKQTLDITRQIQRELNFATIRIADRVRSQSIDYARLVDSNHHFLPLGQDESFRFDEDAGMIFMNDAPLFSHLLHVQDVELTVSPNNNEQQPYVHLEILVSEKSSEESPRISIPIRTTISSRIIQ